MSHYHSEISIAACMPDHAGTFETARDAVEDIKAIIDDEDFTMKVWADPFMAVFKWPGKPSAMNCYAWECAELECAEPMKGGDENGEKKTDPVR